MHHTYSAFCNWGNVAVLSDNLFFARSCEWPINLSDWRNSKDEIDYAFLFEWLF